MHVFTATEKTPLSDHDHQDCVHTVDGLKRCKKHINNGRNYLSSHAGFQSRIDQVQKNLQVTSLKVSG